MFLWKAGVAVTEPIAQATLAFDASYYGLWMQTGAIVASAIGVYFTVRWSKIVACRRATLDIVLSEETDPTHVDQRTEFVKLREKGHLSQYADPENTTGKEASLIRAILNRYELVAIGIFAGTLDEESYKRWCRTTLVKDWKCVKPFVVQLREQSETPTLYCEMEKLAKRWATKVEKPHL